MDSGFKIFHIFYAKNDFFRFLDPPDFRAEGPKIFLGRFFSPFLGVGVPPRGVGGWPTHGIFGGGGTPIPPKSMVSYAVDPPTVSKALNQLLAVRFSGFW